jgi:PTH1 family peptidyl-tRNA hydrolase
MKLIFAQGNPGTQYARTRHNVGFIVLDALAEKVGALWKHEAKFNADIAQLNWEGEKVLLIKPQSYYNETGLVARSFVDFYKLTPKTDVLVVHDELALPFGTVRVREKGSDAGNNGIKSLNAHLGQEYWRIRVGVWNELRDRMDDAEFVLSALKSDETVQLTKNISDIILPLIEKFIKGTIEPSSHR